MRSALVAITLFALLVGCKATVSAPPPGSASTGEAPRIEESLVGKSCRVSLRRDALGMVAPGFAEPMTSMIGGKPALLSGTVEQLTDTWLVLRGQSRTYWIPVDAILMVEIDSR